MKMIARSLCAILATGLTGMSMPAAAPLVIELAPAEVEIELAPPLPARGEDIRELDLARIEPVADEELADQRGGFSWGGMEINLGADLRTYLDGELALQTLVSWDASGSTTSQFVSGALTPADAAQLRAGMLSTGAITMRVGDADIFLANDGQTALLHRVDGPVQNILLNTASNTALRQEIDVQLGLAGYEGFRSDVIDARIIGQLHSMIADTTIGALSR